MNQKTALVVGGTGPTGPFIVNGLLDRGYRVSIFHRGTHEIAEIPPQVEHLHGDPHFAETIDEALKGREFDVAIATYGRIRHLALALRNRTGKFIAIGGVPAYRGYVEPHRLFPAGMAVSTAENAAIVDSYAELRFAHLMVQTEQKVLETHPTATCFRYPYVYGPYQVFPREWCVMRRILDRRPFILLADGGLTLTTHGYAGNLAHAVLLAVDKAVSAGQIYNCGDEQTFSLGQVVEIITRTMNYDWEILSVPNEVATPARPFQLQGTPHHRVVDLSKIRNELGYRDQLAPGPRLNRPSIGISTTSRSAAARSKSGFATPSTTTPRTAWPPSSRTA